MALILVVTGEYIVGVPGIGREVFITQSSGAYDKAYAWIVVAGLLGLAVNLCFTPSSDGCCSGTRASRAGRGGGAVTALVDGPPGAPAGRCRSR